MARTNWIPWIIGGVALYLLTRPNVAMAGLGALEAVLKPQPLHSLPWSWGGANYPTPQSQPSGSHQVLTAVRLNPGAQLTSRRI